MPSNCTPAISVLMSVQNEERYIDAAIYSITLQTYENFEFLIVDDASTDCTASRLDVWAAQDSRIRVWKLDENRGKGRNMNFLLTEALGKYIAFMDGDDIAMPDRFELQLSLLESGAADICGGSVVTFGIGPRKLLRSPIRDCEIKTFLLFDVALLNSAVLMRREVMVAVEHRQSYVPAMDYDFYLRASKHFKMYNLPDVLLARRLHHGQISDTRFDEQVERRRQISLRALADRDLIPTHSEHAMHLALVNPPGNNHPKISLSATDASDLAGVASWLAKLLTVAPSDSCYRAFLAREWYQYSLRHTSFGLQTYRAFCAGGRHFGSIISRRQRMILFTLCTMRIKYQSRAYEWLRMITAGAFRNRRIVRHTLKHVHRVEKDLHKYPPGRHFC